MPDVSAGQTRKHRVRFAVAGRHTARVSQNCPEQAGSQMTSMTSLDKALDRQASNKSVQSFTKKSVPPFLCDLAPCKKHVERCNRKLATKASHLLSATRRPLTKLEVHETPSPSRALALVRRARPEELESLKPGICSRFWPLLMNLQGNVWCQRVLPNAIGTESLRPSICAVSLAGPRSVIRHYYLLMHGKLISPHNARTQYLDQI